jgi:hypothetical protein
MRRQPGRSSHLIRRHSTLNVNCGIVTIMGQVGSRAIAPELITAIRHAEGGVVGVPDRLSYARAKDSDGTLE